MEHLEAGELGSSYSDAERPEVVVYRDVCARRPPNPRNLRFNWIFWSASSTRMMPGPERTAESFQNRNHRAGPANAAGMGSLICDDFEYTCTSVECGQQSGSASAPEVALMRLVRIMTLKQRSGLDLHTFHQCSRRQSEAKARVLPERRL